VAKKSAKDLQAWRDERRQPDHKPPEYYRTAAQRDRDRILYSSAFRRLGGVTQVVAAREEGHLFHNRLTHSLKVAQLARRISQKLQKDVDSDRGLKARLRERGGLDPDVAEAAGLAHDLGHPPFGHIAEKILNKTIRDEGRGPKDGFEGNAQSFRIVTRLAAIDDELEGLNLTRATLNAVLKYPWTAERQIKGIDASKYGVYSTEQDDFEFARSGLEVEEFDRSLEAEVMDWADDIAYSVHDVEDFFRAGLIPLGTFTKVVQLDPVFDRVEKYWDEDHYGRKPKRAEYETAAGLVLVFPLVPPFQGTKGDRAKLRSYTSQRIGTLVEAAHFGPGGLVVDRAARVQAELFKQLTYHYVVANAALATQQVGQREVVRRLYEIYRLALSSGEAASSIFPPRVRNEVAAVMGPSADPRLAVRVAADVVAGMTEEQAVRVFQRLVAVEFGPLLDPAVL
jgi:dGTPase